MTETEIAERYETYQLKINRLRRGWGIPTLGKAGRLERSLPDVTPRQRDLLIGSLLGDGCLTATSSRSARFTESHSLKQADYTRWKASILTPFTTDIHPDVKRVNGREYKSLAFRTHSCPQLRPFYDLFYPPPSRKRRFPSTLVDLMTPFVLAVWFMDDGGRTRRQIRISFGLDDRSRVRACRALRSLGLRPEVCENGASIMFPGQTDLFMEIVGPHLHPCMDYKRPPVSKRVRRDRSAKKLIPSRAAELYLGGMTYEEIGKLYGVGRSTAKRRVEAAGVTSRLSGPRTLPLTAEASLTWLEDFCPKVWEAASDGEKGTLIHEAVGHLVGQPFPHSEEPSKSDLGVILTKLKRAEVFLENHQIRPQSSLGTSICKPFFPNRYQAKYRESLTAFEAWHDVKRLRQAVKLQLSYGDPITPHRILRAITLQCRTPTVFRPLVAKYVYQTYCPRGGRVWDPCSGYGGRLLGAVAAGVKYVATDVDATTVEGNRRLAELLEVEAEIHCCPAETFVPGNVDLVFTSPPYFDRERYRGGDQSWCRYSSYGEWVRGFLVPVISQAWEALPNHGCLVLNVADIKVGRKVHPLVRTSTVVAEAEGFELVDTLGMPLASINRTEACEPVLVFRKSEGLSRGNSSSFSFDGRPEKIKIRQCSVCGADITYSHANLTLCSGGCRQKADAERARAKRARERLANPSGERTFTCQDCGQSWMTKANGNFKWCPTCKESEEVRQRTKVCSCRECGVSFVDTSSKNSMKFCCSKHRQREKYLRRVETTGKPHRTE